METQAQRKRSRREDLSPGEASTEECAEESPGCESVEGDGGKRPRLGERKDRWASDSEDDTQESGAKPVVQQQYQQEEEDALAMEQPTHIQTTIGSTDSGSPQHLRADSAAVVDAALEQQVARQKPKIEDTYNPLIHGCRNVDNYQRLDHIDEGSYGVVYKAQNKHTKEIVALKRVKFNSADGERHGFPITALRETNILLALRHPNIVRIKEMVVGSTPDKTFMVMEYMDADLKTVMRTHRFTLTEVKRLMLQLLSAIAYMHHRWYIHRDLKTSNLLYSNQGKLVVCDFGMARKYGSPLKPYTPGQHAVTLWYRSPELLLGCKLYSTAVDIWSVGCIFAELLRAGQPLFDAITEDKQVDRIFRVLGQPSEKKWPGCMELPGLKARKPSRWPSHSTLRNLFPRVVLSGNDIPLSDKGFDALSSMLHMDPAQRISAETAQTHEWFAEQPLAANEESMPKVDKTSSKGS